MTLIVTTFLVLVVDITFDLYCFFCFVLCGATSYSYYDNYKNRVMTAKNHKVSPHSIRADKPVPSHQSECFIINDLNNVRSFIELFSFMLVPL